MKDNDLPITVLMSVYNGEDYICKSIDSILNQTFTNFEFVIVNDGSDDNTSSILYDYKRKDSRIQLIEHKNIGLTKSLNIGINSSNGYYIARQDADDISYPERLEKQYNYLQQNIDTVLLGTRHREIFNKKKVDGRVYKSEIKKVLRYINPFIHSSVMIQREAFKKIDFYNEKMDTSQDYEAWLKISKIGDVHILDEVLLDRYVLNDSSISSNKLLIQCKNSFKIRIGHINFALNIILFFHQLISNKLASYIWIFKNK